MEENKDRSWFTIDERLSVHQTRLNMCLKELKSELTDDNRQTFEKYKAEEEHEIYLLHSKKEKLLNSPTFLLLIANDIDNKVFITIPTYIEHADEAKYFSRATIGKLLISNNVQLDDGGYVGIIVRKAFYDKMSETDKIDVQSIFANNDVHVTSREILVSNEETTIF